MAADSTKALNTTVIEANQYPVQSVKLFGSDGAEITRTFPLPFLQSRDESQIVEIVHLPADLHSVGVSVTSASPGNVTILDHYWNSASKGSIMSPNTSQMLQELEMERLKLQDERRLRQQSFTFLTTYMDSLAQCKSQVQSEAAQMVTFFDEFVDIGIARSSLIAELDRKLVDVDNRIKEETERLSKLHDDLPVKAVVLLLCNGVEAPPLLTVTYVVKQVSWKPEYALHVSMVENMPSSNLTLDFRCTVTQWTGENWENVSLTLTSGASEDQVSQLIQLHEPKKIDISLSGNVFGHWDPAPHPFPPPWARISQHDVQQPAYPASKQDTYADKATGTAAENVSSTGGLTAGTPQTVSELVSHGPVSHISSGCVFIPSDHAAHHILVTSLSLHADFVRVVVPSIDTRVYYVSEVKNTSEYVLLPGTVKAYLNGRHVSSTKMQTMESSQILECPLAVDIGMKTTHSIVPDSHSNSAGVAFTGKETTTYMSETVLHNTHPAPSRGVIVRCAIPLPADPRVTITLKEPAGLAEIEQGIVFVKEGCLARWSMTGGRKGKEAGQFEWVCDMNPGTEVFKAVWEVRAPQGHKLVEKVRS